MGIVQLLPDVEDWLDADAESWSPLPDREYVALVRRWGGGFLTLIAVGFHHHIGQNTWQSNGG